MELDEIQTPAIVADLAMMEHNMRKYQNYADQGGCALRPHIKTHKIPRLARMQLDFGAKGITCAKLGEAEVMADSGIGDIFMAYPVIGPDKIRRFLDLSQTIRMICSVDSVEGASALAAAARERGITAEVRMEVDIGARRTGVVMPRAVEMAKRIAGMPGLELSGIFGYKAMVLEGGPTLDPAAAGREEGELLGETAQRIREAGIPLRDVSAGSTPTAPYAAMAEGVNEIRPGTYIFQDAQRIVQGAASPEECCGVMKVTVVSTPEKDRAVIDAGTKALAGDSKLHAAPMFLSSYGQILGRPDLRIDRMNEEHGMIVCDGETGLHVGQALYVIPNHICTCINLFDRIYIREHDGSLTETPVAARGRSV